MAGSKRPRTGFDEGQEFHKRTRCLDERQVAIESDELKLQQIRQELCEENPQEKKTVLNFLINHEQHYPVFDRLCSYLGIAEIITLTRTCKTLSGLYKLLLKTQWNIDRRLRRFVENPKEFRAQLGRNNALVSGDFTLQFFERQVWQDCDMHIFVHQYSEVLALSTYLQEVEDYACNDMTPYHIIRDTLHFSRRNRHQINTNIPKIILRAKDDSPLQQILGKAYTTSLVNIISWNKAYSIFPLPTHVQHKTYLLTKMNDRSGILLSDQSQRGWDVQDVLWQEEESPRHPVQLQRFIGDEFTWTIPFDTDDMEPSITPDNVLQYSQFGLQKAAQRVSDDSFYYYRISSVIYEACTLRYRYTHSGFETNFWNECMSDRMNRLTRLQLYQMKPANRPPGAFNNPDFRSHEGAFEKPWDWKYYDDKIPEWYEAWKKEDSKTPDTDDWRI
ncbi:hypothetical protein MMC17_004898 [Xylographa soralifera]|nr:hypothetical protein [Xylographa soralifera]